MFLSVLLLFCDLSGRFDKEQGLGACLRIPSFIIRVLGSLFQCRYPLYGNNTLMLSKMDVLDSTSAGSLIQYIQLLVWFDKYLTFSFDLKASFCFSFHNLISLFGGSSVNDNDWLKSQKKTYWQVTNYDNPPSLVISHWSVQSIIFRTTKPETYNSPGHSLCVHLYIKFVID